MINEVELKAKAYDAYMDMSNSIKLGDPSWATVASASVTLSAILCVMKAIEAKKECDIEPPKGYEHSDSALYLAAKVKTMAESAGTIKLGDIHLIAYAANQVLEVGSCGDWDGRDFHDYDEMINKFK